MSAARERLPNRRQSETFSFEVGGRRYRCTVSKYRDGRIAEVFLNNNKVGSDCDCTARDSAIVFSIAIQHGVPADVIRKALLRDSQDRASGPLGAALDVIALDLPDGSER